MPRVSRRIKRRRRASGYTQRHIEHLERGSVDWFGDLFGDNYPSEVEAWVALKDDILSAWVTEHPRSRPWGWWQYDAPGYRERIDGKPHPFEDPDRPENMKKLLFGKPCCYTCQDDWDAKYETEDSFLRRHELLLPEEL